MGSCSYSVAKDSLVYFACNTLYFNDTKTFCCILYATFISYYDCMQVIGSYAACAFPRMRCSYTRTSGSHYPDNWKREGKMDLVRSSSLPFCVSLSVSVPFTAFTFSRPHPITQPPPLRGRPFNS